MPSSAPPGRRTPSRTRHDLRHLQKPLGRSRLHDDRGAGLPRRHARWPARARIAASGGRPVESLRQEDGSSVGADARSGGQRAALGLQRCASDGAQGNRHFDYRFDDHLALGHGARHHRRLHRRLRRAGRRRQRDEPRPADGGELHRAARGERR